MRRNLIITASLILAFLVGAVVPTIVAALLYLTRPNIEAEYWRGVYDVCLAQTRQPEMCLNSVAGFRARGGWYESPSPGYEWPLPERGYPGQQSSY